MKMEGIPVWGRNGQIKGRESNKVYEMPITYLALCLYFLHNGPTLSAFHKE